MTSVEQAITLLAVSAQQSAERAAAEASTKVASQQLKQLTLTREQEEIKKRIAALSSTTPPHTSVALLHDVAVVLAAVPVHLRKYKLAALAHPEDRMTLTALDDAELTNGAKLEKNGTWRATVLARARAPLSTLTTTPPFRDCAAGEAADEWRPMLRQLKADASQCASHEAVIDMLVGRMFHAHIPHDMQHSPVLDALLLCGGAGKPTVLELLDTNSRARITAAKQPKSERSAATAKQYNVSSGAVIARAVVSVAGAQIDAIVDTGGSHALIETALLDTLAPDAPTADAPTLRSFVCADGEQRRFADPLAARVLEVDVGAGATPIAVYPVEQLAEPLILGVTALQQLGGARIDVKPTTATRPTTMWHAATALPAPQAASGSDTAPYSASTAPAAPRRAPVAQQQSTPHPRTPLAPPSAASPLCDDGAAAPIDVVMLQFDAGIVELRGVGLHDEATAHPERFAHFEPALERKKTRQSSRHRRKSRRSAVQGMVTEHTRRAEADVAAAGVAAAAHLFRPDLAKPRHDSALDPTPLTDDAASYRLPNARAKLDEIIDANLVMNDDEKKWLKGELEIIDNNLQSSEAPPTDYGPVVGPGSIHSIVLKPGADTNSAHARPRKVSFAKARALDETRSQWLRFGVIEPAGPTPTRVLSAPVAVSKRDADGNITGHRVAVDYRPLNNMTERDHYNPPLMTTMLEQAALAEFVTVTDGKALFNQFRLDPATRDLARVVWYDGKQYDFIRAPFGLASILATAQRWMDNTFDSPIRKSYVDDTFSLHMKESVKTAMFEVLDYFRLAKAAGLAINVDKLQLITRTPEMLGHIVDCATSTFRPRPSRLATLAAMEPPTTNRGLRRFLQMGTFWQRFVPGWSAVMRRLTTTIKHGENLVYTADSAAAFEQAKQMLLQACERTPFDSTLPTYITTDANKLGLGYFVSQLHADDVERLVACGGRPTAPYEQRLHVSELELLALRTAIYRDAEFLVGLPLPATWRTDSTIIMDLVHRRLPARSEAVRRFLVELQHGDVSDIRVEHIPGSKNPADAIARQWDDMEEAKREHLRTLLSEAMHPSIDGVAHALLVDVTPEGGGAESSDAESSDGDMSDAAASSDDADAGAVEIDDADVYLPPGTPALTDDASASHVDTDEPSPPHTRARAAMPPPLTEPLPAGPNPDPQPAAAAPLEGAGARLPPIVPSPGTVAHQPDAGLNAEVRRTAAATQADTSRWARDLRAATNGRHASRRARAKQPFRDRAGRLFVRTTVRGVKAARWYVPLRAHARAPDERRRIVRAAHGEAADGGGHRGVAATLARLQQSCWWPNMAMDVVKVIGGCDVCQQLAAKRDADGVLGTDDRYNGRLQHVHADIVEIEGGESGYGKSRYLLIVVDRVTGVLEYARLPDHKAISATRAFESIWLRRYGPPILVTTDGAQELVGTEFARLARENGFKHEPVSARNPQANGTVERAIKTFKNGLRSFAPLITAKGKSSNWDQFLDDARWSYMTAISTARKHSPYELLYGKVPPMQLDVEQQLPAAVEQPPLAAGATRRERDEQHAVATAAATAAATATANATRKARHLADKARTARKAPRGPLSLEPNDVVWLENNQDQFDTKFKNKIRRTGPYLIERTDPLRSRYQLRRWHNQLVKPGWVSVHRLSRCTATSIGSSLDAPVDDDVVRAEPSLAPELTPGADQLDIPSPFGIIRDMREADEGLEVLVEDYTGNIVCRLADTLDPELCRQVKRASRASRRRQRTPVHKQRSARGHDPQQRRA